MINPDVSLYFHIPFCSKKCPYCHFFVLPNDERLKSPFIDALLKEWELRLPQLRGKRVVSIYFGGGTPTKLTPHHYRSILERITHSDVEISSDCEITLEANPEDVTSLLMEQYREVGINRVSLGVQSLYDQDLVLLGRTHNANRAVEAVQMIHRAKITNISIDLMFELPKQTFESWRATLQTLSHLPITHLSLYNLTFEERTIFFKQQKQLLPLLPPEEIRLEMLQIAVQSLESIGLSRYEISAFARPGMDSRHNTGYWTGRPFLGFGPSAFSDWEGARFSNVAHFDRYLKALNEGHFPVDFEERLAYPRNLQERLAVGLRLFKGVDLHQLTTMYGPIPLAVEQSFQQLIEKGWIEKEGGRVRLTPSGQLFHDSVASELIYTAPERS